MKKQVEVNDTIFSKNGSEFYATIKEINGSKVTVSYDDDYEETEIISIYEFKNFDEDSRFWDMPNWTFNFDQL